MAQWVKRTIMVRAGSANKIKRKRVVRRLGRLAGMAGMKRPSWY